MRLLLVALSFTVLSCLGGCIVLPVSGDYYTPTAVEGTVQGYGEQEAPTTLRLERGKDRDVLFLVSGYPLGGSQLQSITSSVEIRIIVPVGNYLKTDLSAVSVHGDAPVSIGKVSSLYAMNTTRLHGDLKMDVVDQVYRGDVMPGDDRTLFVARIPLEGTPPTVLAVELPAMEVDGISYPPLTVTFMKTHGWWWHFYGP